jgi:hypothetical protein
LRDEGFDDETFDMAFIQSITEVDARLEENLRKEKENGVCSSKFICSYTQSYICVVLESCPRYLYV